MSSSALTLFPHARERLISSVDHLSNRESSRVIESERMIVLAELLLPAFLQKDSVVVRYQCESGYQLIQSPLQHDLSEVRSFARGLSLVSGCSVTIVCGGESVEHLHSLPIRVELPEVFPTFPVLNQILRQATSRLTHHVYSSPEAVSEAAVVTSLERAGLEGLFALKHEHGDRYEIVIKSDTMKLGSEALWSCLNELTQSAALFRIRLEPSEQILVQTAYEVLGNTVPWKLKSLSGSHRRYTLIVDRSFADSTETFHFAAQTLMARSGIVVNLSRAPLLGERAVISPNLVPLTRGPDLGTFRQAFAPCLHAQVQSESDPGNIVTVHIPFSLPNNDLSSRLRAPKSTSPYFIAFEEKTGWGKVNPLEYAKGVDHLCDLLEINGITSSVNKQTVTIRIQPSVVAQNIADSISVIELLKSSASAVAGSVEFNHRVDEAGVFSLLETVLGHSLDWSFSIRKQTITITTRNADAITPEIQSVLATVLGREIKVSRNPETEFGIMVFPHPENSLALGLLHNQTVVEGLSRSLTLLIGENPIIYLEGNRVIAYSRLKYIPERYLEHIKDTVYGLGLPLVIRQDNQAAKIEHEQRLSILVETILPKGTYLHRIVKEADQFTLLVDSTDTEPIELNDAIRQIEQAAALPIVVSKREMSPQVAELFQQIPDEKSRRYLSKVIKDDNRFVSLAEMERAFLDIFDHPLLSPDQVSLSRDDAVQAEDLTNLDCFSMDSEEATLHEDMYSVTELENGNFEFGIHVVRATGFVPYGSYFDLRARTIGVASKCELQNETQSLSLFPSPHRWAFDFRVGLNKDAFTLLFQTTSELDYIEGSERLLRSIVSNSNCYTHQDLDREVRGQRHDWRIAILERFLIAHPEHITIAEGETTRVRSSEMVRGMSQLFNSVVSHMVQESGISLPIVPAFFGGEEFGNFKFTGPARNFLVLLSQRQVDAYLSNAPGLSEEQIRVHESKVGRAADSSVAYQILSQAISFHREFPGAHMIINKQGLFMAIEPIRESSE